MKFFNLSLLFMAISSAQAADSIANSLTTFTGHSQTNFPSQPSTLNGSGLNVSFVWAGGAGAWERIAFGASGATFGGNSPATGAAQQGRNYIRTNEVDFSNTSFRAFVTVSRLTREAVYFGMGTGALGEFKQPDVKTGNASVFLELQEGFSNASRRLMGGTAAAPINTQVGYDGMTSVTGLMRIRMDYNAIAKTVCYAIDYNFAGPFVADQTFPLVNVASIAGEWSSGENSRIFFGGQRNVVFSDFVINASGPPYASEQGQLTREVWNNVPGSTLASFTTSPRFLQPPDSVSTFSGASVAQNIGQDFASRIRGYITAPVTGAYTFWIASDDQSELRISPTNSKMARTKVAFVSAWVNPLEWDIMPSQKSSAIQLVAGQKYFIEALHKEASGGDHLAIAWQIPGGNRELIPSSVLESFSGDANDLDDDDLPDSWETANGFSIATPSTTPLTQLPTADLDRDGYTNFEEATYGMNPNVHGGMPGALLLETWNSIAGSSVAALTKNSKFTAPADQSEFIFSAETPVNRGDNFGVRLRGRLVAPTTGDYTFYVAGDDACELWLSASASQFAKQKIATVNGWTGIRQWNRFPTQASGPVTLVAGQKYYLEALMKEASLSDHLSIGWKTPGSSTITIIPASVLESYAYDLEDPDGDNMPSSWEAANGLDPAVNDAALDPDADGITNFLEYTAGSNPQVASPNGLAMELWTDIAEYSTRALVANTKFYAAPQTVTPFIGSTTGEQTNPGVYFATRARGYLVAPVTGDYRFWISGRNGVELYLSTDSTKYKKRLIAEINPDVGGGHGIMFNDANLWDQFSSQQSAVIQLEAGESYFFETLQVNGHAPGPHLSLAWAPAGGARVPIPANNLRPYVAEPADADDDYLPDAWEAQYGLDVQDNGFTDLARQGERGDYDADGLSNRDEYLLGTNPSNADTDGDSLSDFAELRTYQTNPLVSDAPRETIVQQVPVQNVAEDSDGTSFIDGTVFLNQFRGSLSWDFNVPENGLWIMQLATRLRGTLFASEGLDVKVSIDGRALGRYQLSFGSEHRALLRIVTPQLQSGTHRLKLEIDNLVARRQLGIESLSIISPGGFDLDNNGVLDRIEVMLAESDLVSIHPISSRISPFCLEGYARLAGEVLVNGESIIPGAGETHWYFNLPLQGTEPSEYRVKFASGLESLGSISWEATNVADGGEMVVRVGDSLKLGAWYSNPTSPLPDPFSITIDGVSHPLVGMDTFNYTFTTPGVQEVTATTSNGSYPITLRVKVLYASLPDHMLVLQNNLRYFGLTTAQAAPELFFQASRDLRLGKREEVNANEFRFQLYPEKGGNLGITARLWENGPIADVASIRSTTLSDAIQNGATTSTFSGSFPGFILVKAPLVVTDLPPGGTVRITIFRAGVTFLDGSTVKTLSASDFANGIVYLEFLFPEGMAGGYCHYIDVYDANNTLLGRR